jgi:hypothetical protein
MGTRILDHVSVATLESLTGLVLAGGRTERVDAVPELVSCSVSTSEFQLSQLGQRPYCVGNWPPHCWHT